MQIAAVIALVEGILTAIPAATKAVEAIHTTIDNLFGAGQITVEQQAQLHDAVDKIAAQVLASQPPPALTVEADPQS